MWNYFEEFQDILHGTKNYSSTSFKVFIKIPKRNILVKITLILKKKNPEGNSWKNKSLRKSCNAPKRNIGSLKGRIRAPLLVITGIFLLLVSSLEMHFYWIILYFKNSLYFQRTWKFSLQWLLRSIWISLILVTISKEMNSNCHEQGNFHHIAVNFISISFPRVILKMVSIISFQ